MVFVKWIPKKLASGEVKKYPYRYRSFRKGGKVKSVYLGPAGEVSVVHGEKKSLVDVVKGVIWPGTK